MACTIRRFNDLEWPRGEKDLPLRLVKQCTTDDSKVQAFVEVAWQPIHSGKAIPLGRAVTGE